jgi:uncharacterized protein
MTPQEKLAEQISLLESLSVSDAEIRRLDAQIAEEQTALDALKKELGFLDGKLATDRTSVEEMQKTIGELSIELRQMANQIERSREKLGRARNERESMAAEREVDELRKLLRDREDEVGKLNVLVDTARKSVTDLEAQRTKVWGELSSTESATSQRITEVRKERERKIAERAEVSKKVQPLTLRRYEAVRSKRGSGLAPVVNGTCRACHIALPPQLFQRLMRREVLEECPSCKRILYWAPEAQPSSDEKAD